MPPNPTTPQMRALPPGLTKRLLGGLSIFTMVMTVPQVLTIWISHRASGISMLSGARTSSRRLSGFGTAFRNVIRTSTYRA